MQRYEKSPLMPHGEEKLNLFCYFFLITLLITYNVYVNGDHDKTSPIYEHPTA